MRHYDELAVYEREGYEIIVDKTYEDLDPKDCFDESCYDTVSYTHLTLPTILRV